MGKFIKIFLISLCSLILIIALGAIAVLTFIDPNNFKDEISAAVAKRTGRDLTIQGNIEWSFFPYLGLQLYSLQLSNAPGFDDKPFAELDEADISVKLLPLITGHVETGKLALHGLNVNLSKNANGKNNWDDMVNKLEGTKPAPQPAPVSEASSKPTKKHSPSDLDISISGVNIKNAQLNWQDQQHNQTATVILRSLASKNINTVGRTFPLSVHLFLKSTNPELDGNLRLNSIVEYNSHQQSSNLNKVVMNAELNSEDHNTLLFKLQGDTHVNLTKQTFSIEHLLLKLNNLTAKGQLRAESIIDAPKYRGNLTVPNFDLDKLLKSLNMDPHFKSSQALTKVSANAGFSGTKNSFKILGLKANVDESQIKGSINMSNIEKNIADIDISIDQLNLDDYATLASSKTTSKKSSAAQKQSSASRSPSSSQPAYELLNKIQRKGKLHIGRLTAAGLRADFVNTSLKAKNGIISFNPINANMYGGKFAGKLSMDFTGPVPRYRFTESLNNIKIQPLLTDAAGINKISGTGYIKSDVTALGTNGDAIVRSLNGNLRVNLTNGKIAGLDILQKLDTAYSLFKKQQIPS